MNREKKVDREKHPKREVNFALLAVLVQGSLVRLLYFIQSLENPFYFKPLLDEHFYIDQGRYIAQVNALGNAFTFHLDPLFSYLLALLFSISDETGFVRIMMVLCDVLNIGLIYLLGRQLWSNRIGLIAGLLYAYLGVAIFYSSLILKPVLTVTFMLVALLLYLRALRSDRRGPLLMVGAWVGLTALLRGNFFLLLPLLLGHLFMMRAQRRINPWRAAQWLVIGYVAVLSVAMVRNVVMFDQWHALASNGGYVLYSSNNPENRMENHLAPAFIQEVTPLGLDRGYREEAERREGRPFNSHEASAYWMKQAILYRMEHISSLPRAIMLRLTQLISNHEIPSNYSYNSRLVDATLLSAPFIGFAFVMGFGLPGLWMAGRRDKSAWVLALPVGVIVITGLVFYTAARIRMPMTVCLLLGAAYSLDWFYGRLLAMRRGGVGVRRQVGLLLFISILLMLLSLFSDRWSQGGQYSEIDYDLKIAHAHIKLRQYEKAGVILKQWEGEPNWRAEILLLYGNIEFKQNRFAQSALLYQQVLSLEPEHFAALNNLGVALFKSGDYNAARDYLERSLELKHDKRAIHYLKKIQSNMRNSEPLERSDSASKEGY